MIIILIIKYSISASKPNAITVNDLMNKIIIILLKFRATHQQTMNKSESFEPDARITYMKTEQDPTI